MKARMSMQGKPSVMKGLNAKAKAFKRAQEVNVLNSVAKRLAMAGVEVESTPKYVEVTDRKLQKRGIIDLKPMFAMSSKRKEKEDGGWYLVIPIAIKARSFKTSTIYKRALKEFSDLGAGTSRTESIEGFLQGRTQNTLSSLAHSPVSSNITGVKNETGKRTSYFAFRTVSDKSPASSWIVGRSNVNKDNTSKTLQRDIARMMKWQLKQIMGG